MKKLNFTISKGFLIFVLMMGFVIVDLGIMTTVLVFSYSCSLYYLFYITKQIMIVICQIYNRKKLNEEKI
jgi:hypothetical protein